MQRPTMRTINPAPCGRAVLKGLAASSLLVLGACALGPDYERPAMELGQAYKAAGSGTLGEQIVGASSNEVRGWVPARPGDASLRGDWWTLFNDPALSQLMQTLQDDNLSIIQAEAQYRQAQALLQSARSGFFPTVGASAAGTRSGS